VILHPTLALVERPPRVCRSISHVTTILTSWKVAFSRLLGGFCESVGKISDGNYVGHGERRENAIITSRERNKIKSG